MAAWSSALIDMQLQVGASPDFPSVMNTILASGLRLTPSADGGVIGLVHGNELEISEAIGTMWPHRSLRLPIQGTLSAHCIRTGEPVRFGDARSDPRISSDHFARFQARSGVIVPIPFADRSVGVLGFHSRLPDAFSEFDVLSAQILVGPLAIGYSAASRKVVEDRLTTESRRFAATFEQAAVGIAHVAPDGQFLLINDRFCEIAGHPREALLTHGFQQITHPEDLEVDLHHVEDLLAGGKKTYSMEKRYIRDNGKTVWVNLTVSLVRDSVGQPEFFVAVIEDISDRKQAEVDARHDPLTGLLNRRGMERRIDLGLCDRRGVELPLAVVYADLDGFKAINDEHGHAEGDRMLIAIAKELNQVLRTNDTLARIGGDEFVVLMPSTDAQAAEHAIARMVAAVEDCGSNNACKLSMSAGAVIVEVGCSWDAAEVIGRADRLMYKAKFARSQRAEIETISVDAVAKD